MSYLWIFALNLAVECAVVAAVLGMRFWKRIFVMMLILNLATHPLLWWALPKIPGVYLLNLVLAEIVVVAVEVSLGLMFFRAHFSRARVVIAILAANFATFFMTFVV